jgi:tetratricopeptide (TPR) repeat protein
MLVPGYEVVREIGRGAAGAVLLARTRDRREVAIKVLVHATGADALERFERERRLLGSFTARDGFIPLLDSGVGPSGPFLVMPYYPGGTLRARLEKGALGVKQTVALGRVLAAAVAKAHERGVVHRDLKPENIVFDEQGVPLIADLGLAKHWDARSPGASQSVSVSNTGVFRGTAGYMAQEQMEDAKAVGPPADVFALGAILYECLGGKPAFTAESFVELLVKVNEGRFEPLQPLRPDAPEALVAAIERALSPRPERRFQNGRELRRALDARPPWRLERLLPPLGAAALLVSLVALIAVAKRHKDELPAPPPPLGNEVALVASRDLTAVDHATLAQAALRARDYRRAALEATASLDLDPNQAVTWALLARAELRVHACQRALVAAQTAIRHDGTLADAFALRGEARCWLGDDTVALEDAERALALGAKGPEVYAARGFARLAQKKFTGAIVDLSRRIELEPGEARAWGDRAYARLMSGALDDAFSDAQHGLGLDPFDATCLAVRGRLRSIKNDPGALEDLDGAVGREPDAAAWLPLRALELIRRGKVDAARADLDRAKKLLPRVVETRSWKEASLALPRTAAERDGAKEHVRLAYAAVKENDWQTAVAEGRRAIELDPSLREGYIVTSGLLLKHQQPAEAIAVANKGLEVDPGSAELFVNRGYAEVDLGRFKEALADGVHAAALAPSLGMAYQIQGFALARQGEYPPARKALDKACELMPGDGSNLSVRGVARFFLNDPDGALDDAARALALDARDSVAHGVRGLVLSARKDPGGLAELDRAVAAQPDQSLWLLTRCSARISAGDRVGARADLDHVLALYPDAANDPRVVQLRQALAAAGQ